MIHGDEAIRVDLDDATSILRSLTSGGLEPSPEVSCADFGDSVAGDTGQTMWF